MRPRPTPIESPSSEPTNENDGNRFADPEETDLLTLGAHMMWVQDMGHIYDRKHVQYYESSVFEWKQAAKKIKLKYEAQIPKGTQLEFSIRTSPTKEDLKNQSWKTASVSKDDRFIQYRATFTSDNGDRYPVLDKVSIDLQ